MPTFVSVLTAKEPINKQIIRTGDGSLKKHPARPVASARIRSHEIRNLDEFKSLLDMVADNPAKCIMLGYNQQLADSQESAHIITQKKYARLFGASATGIQEKQGALYLTRTKDNFKPSSIALFDYDVGETTPDAFRFTRGKWVDELEKIIPGFTGTGKVFSNSASGRILVEGSPLKSAGFHCYVWLNGAQDDPDLGRRLYLKALSEGLAWVPELPGREESVSIKAAPQTIFDPSVFSPERVVYAGSPVIRGPELALIGPELEIQPGSDLPTESCSFDMKRAAEVKLKYAIDTGIQTGGNDRLYLDMANLELNTEVELDTGQVVTVRDWWASMDDLGHAQTRCQTPFRQSDSQAGILDVDDYGRPYLIDVGTQIRHILVDNDKGWIDEQLADEDFEGMESDMTGRPPVRDNVVPITGRDDAAEDLVSSVGPIDIDDAQDNLLNQLVRNFVYNLAEDRYYELKNMSSMSSSGFNQRFAKYLRPRVKASDLFARHVDSQFIDTLGWMPVRYNQNHDKIYRENGMTKLNIWQGFGAVKPAAGDVTPWLDLLKHLIDNEEERELIKQRMAFDVQFPDKKCNWSVGIIGIHGSGKDSLLKPLVRIFDRAAGSLTAEDVKSTFDNAWLNKKVLVLSETSHIPAEAMAGLKLKLTSAAATHITLSIKYGKPVTVPNIASAYFLSNDMDALRLDRSERRFLVSEAGAVLDKDTAHAYHTWLEQGGYEALFDYFLNLDLSGFDSQVLPMRTEALEEMFEYSRTGLEAAIKTMLDEDPVFRGRGVVLPGLVHRMLENAGWRRVSLQGVSKAIDKLGYRKSRIRPALDMNTQLSAGLRVEIGSEWDKYNTLGCEVTGSDLYAQALPQKLKLDTLDGTGFEEVGD